MSRRLQIQMPFNGLDVEPIRCGRGRGNVFSTLDRVAAEFSRHRAVDCRIRFISTETGVRASLSIFLGFSWPSWPALLSRRVDAFTRRIAVHHDSYSSDRHSYAINFNVGTTTKSNRFSLKRTGVDITPRSPRYFHVCQLKKQKQKTHGFRLGGFRSCVKCHPRRPGAHSWCSEMALFSTRWMKSNDMYNSRPAYRFVRLISLLGKIERAQSYVARALRWLKRTDVIEITLSVFRNKSRFTGNGPMMTLPLLSIIPFDLLALLSSFLFLAYTHTHKYTHVWCNQKEFTLLLERRRIKNNLKGFMIPVWQQI